MEYTLKKWLLEMIACFREEYNKLTDHEKEHISPSNNFHKHLQIELIQFINPVKGFMILTFFDDRPDLEIKVHDPIEAYDYVDFIEELISDKKWDKEEAEVDYEHEIFPEHRNLRSRLEGLFASYIKWTKRAENPYPKRYGHILSIGSFGYVWFLIGYINELDPTQFALDIIKNAKQRAAAKKTPRKPVQAPTRVSGYGTYFYPAIWIDDFPDLDFREQASGGLFQLHETELFSVPYKGNKVVVRKGGFITVTESDKLRAKEYLNEIFATALINDIPSYAVRETELDSVTVEEDSGRMVGYMSQMDSMRSTIRERLSDTNISLIRFERENVSQEKLKEIIRKSERITSNGFKKNQLLDMLESYTHLQNAEYTQSFVFSWLIIEREISRLWGEYLEKSKIEGQRKRTLSNTANWTMHIVLETLNMLGIINDEGYRILNKFRYKRNRVIHRGENVTKEEAEICYQNALNFLSKKLLYVRMYDVQK